MKNKFKHLSVFDRVRIEQKYKEGWSLGRIAKDIDRSKSSVSREIAKNKSKVLSIYKAEVAHDKALNNRKKRGKRKLLKNQLILDYVVDKLKIGWTPEQISLRIPIDTEFSISYESIYQYIYSKEAPKILRRYLPFRHRQRHRKGYRKVQKLERLYSLPSIEERPAEVNLRLEIGHFEDDSIVSRQSKERVKSLNERSTGIVFFSKVKDGSKEATKNSVLEKLKLFPTEYRKSLTRDRGTENYDYLPIEKQLNMKVYFAHPYCSHERGSNENLNGLFRRYFPKKTDFSKVTDQEIKAVEKLINNRPRKRLCGKTPLEVLYERTGVAITY